MSKYARFIKEHIWGPTGSIILHALILFLLMRYVVFDVARQDEPTVEVVMEVISPPEELDPIDVDLEELDDIPDVVEAVEIPVVSPDTDPPVIDAADVADAPDVGDFEIVERESPVTIHGMYASRFGEEREGALQRHAGGYGEATEAAVMRALRWLKDHQYADGSWGPRYRAAMTGLSLLTFLAHGETTGSEEFGDTVRRGLRYMLSTQNDRGWFIGGGSLHHPSDLLGRSQLQVYEHVIATYAVAEAYGLTAIPMLKLAMEDAVQVIIDGQLDNGGWNYGFEMDGPQYIDVSLGGWIVQALKAAELAGAENRGLKRAIDNGIRGIRTMTDPGGSGLFAYSTRMPSHSPDHTITGVAVLALQLTGHVSSEEARAAMRPMRDLNFNWHYDADDRSNHRHKVGRWPFYAWYYITQARFQHSPGSWRPWNRQFAPIMVREQNPDGSWCPPPGSIEAHYGPVYATTLSALMLQVYYRLLPTFQPIAMDDVPDVTDTERRERITIRFE